MPSHSWQCHLAIRSSFKYLIFNDLSLSFLSVNVILSYKLK